ncbi:hypothetical protein ABPG72_006248 [Tetrahymena utriculariae]
MKSFIFLLILNLLKTISVYSKQYLCSDINPNQSYCDSNHSCQKCLNADCQYCLSDLNTCTQCKNKFLFNNQCLFNPPQGAYCDPFTKICTKCKVDNCINCQANVNYCSQRDQQSNYIYLYQNNCLNTKNDYFDCDSLNVCSIQPPTYCTANCQSCNYQTKVCYQCQNGFSKLISQPITLPSCVSSQPPNSSLIQSNYFQCPNLCSQCNSNFDCLLCQNTYHLQNGMCQICQNQNQGPNKSTQICEQCQVLNCQNCIQDSSICNKCIDGYFLVQNSCQSSHPISYYCDQRQICIPCKIGCTTCDKYGICNSCSPQCNQCEDQNTCTACGQNFYLKNKECKCKQGYYDSINLICLNCESNTSKYACDQQIQNQCYYFNDQNKCVDMKNKNLYCNDKNECFEEKLDSTYCRQEADNSTPLNTYLCRQCSVYCQECTGDSNIQCSSCVDGIVLKGTTCEKLFTTNSTIYTREKIEQVTQQAKITSQATVGSAIALSAVQNVFQSSSFAVVNSALNCQKLSYIILVNNNLPNQIFSPLHKVKSQIPTQQFQFLNIFKSRLDQNSIIFPDIRFESMDLSYNIVFTCGQGIVLCGICLIIFAVFYLLTEKMSNQKIISFSRKCYELILSSFIIQYFQLSMSIFVIGINLQIKYFIDKSNYDGLAIKIFALIILSTVTIIIFQQQYNYLNRYKDHQVIMNFYEINRVKILNDTIFESKPRRNFVLIYLFIESYVIPSYFIQFNNKWQVISIVSIVVQLMQIAVVAYLMPFLSKLTNWYFLLSGLLWLSLFIQYFLLNFYQSNIGNDISTLDNISYCFLINIQLILLINPAYTILALLVYAYQIVQKKLEERKKAQKIQQTLDLSNFQRTNLQILQLSQMQQKTIFEFEKNFSDQFEIMVSQKSWMRTLFKK